MKKSSKQIEREIFEEPKSAEEKLRTGDPAASIEIVSKAKAKTKAAASSEAASGSGSGGVAQIISDTVGQFIKPKTKDQGTMIAPKRPPQLPKPVMATPGTGTSPLPSPKPSPPPTPKSSVGSPKPDPPSLPAEAVDQPMAKSGLPFKAPPPMLTKTSPRAPPLKSAAPIAAPRWSLRRRLRGRSRLQQQLLPRERVDRSPLHFHHIAQRGTPSGTSTPRERASAESSPSSALICPDCVTLEGCPMTSTGSPSASLACFEVMITNICCHITESFHRNLTPSCSSTSRTCTPT